MGAIAGIHSARYRRWVLRGLTNRFAGFLESFANEGWTNIHATTPKVTVGRTEWVGLCAGICLIGGAAHSDFGMIRCRPLRSTVGQGRIVGGRGLSQLNHPAR